MGCLCLIHSMDPKSDNSMVILKHVYKRYTFDTFLIQLLVCITSYCIFILPLLYTEMPQICPINKLVVKKRYES